MGYKFKMEKDDLMDLLYEWGDRYPRQKADLYEAMSLAFADDEDLFDYVADLVIKEDGLATVRKYDEGYKLKMSAEFYAINSKVTQSIEITIRWKGERDVRQERSSAERIKYAK